MNDLLKASLSDVAGMLGDKKISSKELTKLSLERAKENKELNNFITLSEKSALCAAEEADRRIAAGEKGSLLGVPIAVKDNISVKGMPLTCASKILSNYVPEFSASVVEALEREGAVIVGKLNMDEFAMGSGNENSFFGAAKNFHDKTRVTGGSSGGSANTVAACECFASLGSDTGGSIRQPASYCGVVGLKPTYSQVSRFGLVAFASSLDQIGPLTRTVRDSAAMLKAISFHDKKDSTSSKLKRPDFTAFSRDIKGKRIGIAKEFFSDALSGIVKARLLKTAELLRARGAVVEEVSISSFEAALATYYVLSSAEAASNLARFDGIKYGVRAAADNLIDIYYNSRTDGFGDEVKRRIMMGNYVLSSGYYDAYYLKALKARTIIKNDFDKVLSDYDAILSPVAPDTAFRIGETRADTTEVYLSDIYTVPVNIAGLPAISVPAGCDDKGLPIGMQFIGRMFGEMDLFSLASAVEEDCKNG